MGAPDCSSLPHQRAMVEIMWQGNGPYGPWIGIWSLLGPVVFKLPAGEAGQGARR